MSDIIISILSSAAVSAALSAGLVFLAKSWISVRLENAIKSEYDQKLESLKAQLKSQYDTELEKLKSQLRLDAFRHETQIADLHARRAETISETYIRLRKLHVLTHDYISFAGEATAESREQRRIAVAESIDEFEKYYYPKELFVPESTAVQINELRRKHLNVLYRFKRYVEFGHDFEKSEDTWLATVNTMDKDIVPVFDALKSEFRKLLGDSPIA